MSYYRLIHYVPSPVRGSRFPIAAAVVKSGQTLLVEAEKLPSPECLGGKEHAAVLALARQSLRSLHSFESLPAAVGPHLVLDEIRSVPGDVANAETWVRKHVLNARPTVAHEKRHRSPNRSTYGIRFFDRWNVSEYVRRTFEPDTDAGGWLSSAGGGALHPVTHWVSGRSRLFLMEPIVPSRDNLEHDLRDVGQQFLAYRYAIQNAPKRDAELLAYLLKGGDRDARQHAITRLEGSADRVLDLSNENTAQRFTSEIRELALSARSQGEFGD